MGYHTRKRMEETNNRARALRQGGNMAEALLWSELKARKLGGHKFVRQSPIGPYFADFLCRERKLVVEVDGHQHAGSVHDEKRDAFMKAEGYSVIRFWNGDVLKRQEDVCRTILAVLNDEIDGDVSSSDLKYIQSDR